MLECGGDGGWYSIVAGGSDGRWKEMVSRKGNNDVGCISILECMCGGGR